MSPYCAAHCHLVHDTASALLFVAVFAPVVMVGCLLAWAMWRDGR